jgi:dTDP-4-amino-4,6-dideoxygalactose transaminase
MIQVTKTFLPPLDSYMEYLKKIWANNQVANRGPLVRELESKIQQRFDVPFVLLTNNGTISMQIALRAMEITGTVITTPFSYVATTSSLVWEHCIPVFVDIDEEHLTIDEKLIENAIRNDTSAILATHVFGNPCNVNAIARIAEKHNLKVIYDAAHCFDVNYNGKSIFGYGDVSSCSFHATKLFHTGEGGALFTSSVSLYEKLFYHHNFGHKGKEDYHGLGINGKISELNAAMGLAVWPYLEEIISSRKKAVEWYDRLLERTSLSFMKLRDGTEWNYSYYPVVFPSEKILLRTMSALASEEIFPRRYFYPSLTRMNYVSKQEAPVAERISSSILCLPLSHDILPGQQESIVKIIKQSL